MSARRALVAIAVALAWLPACGETTSSAVIFDGQSLNNLPVDGSFPELVLGDLDVGGTNVAVNGVSWELLGPSAPERLHSHADDADRTVLVMTGGQGDLIAGLTGAEVYDLERAYAEEARDAGFDYVVITTIPPAGYGFTAASAAERVAHNALLLESTDDAFDVVVDLAGDPLIGQRNGPAYADKVHFNTAGARAAADLIGPAVESLL